MTGLVEGIVGDPQMWAEDPVAAGAFAVTNIGSFFIPVAGGAAAAGKVGTVVARAELAGVLEMFEQTRIARHELHPPVGFGERMNAAVEQAA